MKLVKRLWSDEAGFIVSAELILIATIVVIGLLVGLAAVRDGIVSELSDVAGALQDVNQSYSIDGVVGHNANTAGFNYLDLTDECDSNDQTAGVADNCINFAGLITEEGSFAASTSGGT
jgi:Flp pilus assembly pilin Flp